MPPADDEAAIMMITILIIMMLLSVCVSVFEVNLIFFYVFTVTVKISSLVQKPWKCYCLNF